MTDEQLQEVFLEAKKHVRESCCEYHPHSALRGCITGDPQAVIICKLVEVIMKERRIVREATAQLAERSV